MLISCEVLAVVAWDVASFLVPHQSSEDLVQRGIPAPEARQRSFFRTSLMERLSSLIHVTLISGIVVHLIIPGLICLSLIPGVLYNNFDIPGTLMVVVDFLFGHIEDECNQPLGICAMIYWLQVIVKFAAVIGWRCWHGCSPDFGPPTFRRLIPCLFRIFAIVTVLFEVIFPVTTFIMLMLADSCTPGLIEQTWVVLCFSYAAWSSLTTCPSHIPIESPASLVNTFTRIPFDPDTFNEETYAKSCAICSSDFAASTASTAIVSPPCAAGRHVFHEQCLVGWFERARSCPLCRSRLDPAAGPGTVEPVDVELALAVELSLASWERSLSTAWACSGRAHLENIARVPTMSGFTKFHQNLTTVSPARVPVKKRLLPHHFINPANTSMPNLSFPALHAACHLPQVFAAAKSLPPISAGVGGPSDIKEQTQINAKNIKELQDYLAIPGFLQGCRLWITTGWHALSGALRVRGKNEGELSETWHIGYGNVWQSLNLEKRSLFGERPWQARGRLQL